MNERKQSFLISFGLGGHSVESLHDGNCCHTSGYDSPESFERALSRGEKGYGDLRGLPVLDKRAVLGRTPALAISSPMVDVKLEDGEVDRLDKRAAGRMLPGLEDGFQTLAAVAVSHDEKKGPGPLDHISVGDYVRWWTSRGARLGHIDENGTAILWDDHEEGK